MKAREKKYAENEVIFYEGDASTAVYVIVSGCVELSKETHDGPVLLATLGPGEMFGEMGILDGNPRSATAMAIQESMIQVVARKDFLRSLREEPDQAMAVMHKLVERLRGADSLLAGAQHKPEKRGLLGTLLGLLRRRRRPGPAGGAALPDGSAISFQVVIAQLNGDIEAQMADYLRSVLDGRDGLRVTYVGRPLRLDDCEDPAQLTAAGLNARQLLAEEQADLVIWGDVSDEGDLRLRFTPVVNPDEERPGGFALANCLDLPVGFDDAMLEFLYAIVLAAIEPQNEAQSLLQRRVLPPAAEAIMALGAKPSMSAPLAAQRAHLTCFGHVVATLGGMEPKNSDYFDRAVASYRAAAARVGRNDSQGELVMLHKHLAAVHMAMAERREDDPEPLEQAVEAYRAILDSMLKSAFPVEWAATQNRLGMALYRLDLRTGRTELLKEALAAYQAALQTFSKYENPARWAEVMHNLAQALEVYGDQMRSPDVLERAIDACRLVSETLSRDTSPLAWAAVQNTLGSALYLRDKHGHSTEHLAAAEETLRGALEVYLSLGHEKPAVVARRNLAHVQKLRKARKDVKLIEPDWAGDGTKRLPGPETES